MLTSREIVRLARSSSIKQEGAEDTEDEYYMGIQGRPFGFEDLQELLDIEFLPLSKSIDMPDTLSAFMSQ